MIKKLTKTLLISALLAAPFAAAQAHETEAAHAAWIKAQKIDVQPTLKVQETQVPADSATGASGSGMSGTSGTTMPSSQTPSMQMPQTQTPAYPATNSGMGTKAQ